MGAVFEHLGYRVFHGPFRGIENDPMNFNMDSFLRDSGPVDDLLESYDAFQDYPFMYCYPYIAEKFPDAKFILTERDPQRVAESDMNMWLKLGKPKEDIPPVEVFVERYNNHHSEVLRYFESSERLLRLTVGKEQDLSALCTFLGHAPNAVNAWPQRNQGTYGVRGWLANRYWPLHMRLIRLRDRVFR